MSGKFIVGLLAFVMFSASMQAVAGPAERKEKQEARATNIDTMKAIETVSKEYKEKDGKMDKISYTAKKAMMDALTVYTAKAGVVEVRAMVRLLFSPEVPLGSQKAFMDKYEQLSNLKLNGTAQEKEAASLDLQLINSMGTYDNSDYKEADFKQALQAVSALLKLSGKQGEKAKSIKEKFIQARAEGKTFMEATNKAFEGKEGGFKALCGSCPDACKA
jgi:hypothetical protein